MQSRVIRDPGDQPDTKIFACYIVGEGGEATVTPLVVGSRDRPNQIREMASLVDQWAKALKAFIHDHPERLGL